MPNAKPNLWKLYQSSRKHDESHLEDLFLTPYILCHKRELCHDQYLSMHIFLNLPLFTIFPLVFSFLLTHI